MSDKKNEITDEEMKEATGGASYSISAEKTQPRGTYPSGVEGSDPGGVGNTDPVYGELGDRNLKAVSGGTNTRTEGSDFYRDNEPEADPSKTPTHERGSMGGQVK